MKTGDIWMIDYGTIQSVTIGTDKDTDKQKYICEVEFSDEEDIRTIQVMNMSGINSRPIEGHKVAIIDLGGGFEVGVCSDDEIDADLEDGETEIFSFDPDGNKLAKLKCNTDSHVVVNNGEDWGVRYSKLEEHFNELQQKHNDLVQFVSNFITVTYNLHNHPTAPVGPVSVPSLTGTSSSDQSTGDISESKVDDFRLT